MKKIVLLVMGFVLLGTGFVQAAPAKITNTRLIQATKDTTVTYVGIRIFVPAGQTVVVGQLRDGTVVVRGMNLNNVQLDNTTISSQGASVLNYQPQTQRLEVVRGTSVTVQDANGRTAVLSQGAAITASDIRTPTTAKLGVEAAKTVADTQSQQEEAGANEIPDFIAESEISNTASEQASQDVKETETVLSQSAL